MKLETPCQTVGFLRVEGLIQGSFAVGVEVVLHEDDNLCFGKSVCDTLEGVGIVDSGAALSDPGVPFSCERLNPAEQVDAAVAFVLRVYPLDPTRFRLHRQQHVADELTRLLVEADHRALRVEGALVNVQHIF